MVRMKYTKLIASKIIFLFFFAVYYFHGHVYTDRLEKTGREGKFDG